MKEIKDFIIEKLHIDKNTKLGNTYDNYWFGEINNYEDMPKEFFDKRKSPLKDKERGLTKNRPWYAVAIYLSYNPESSNDDIRQNVWPNKTAQHAELFTGLIEHNIIAKGRKKSLNPFDEWTIPSWVRNRLF